MRRIALALLLLLMTMSASIAKADTPTPTATPETHYWDFRADDGGWVAYEIGSGHPSASWAAGVGWTPNCIDATGYGNAYEVIELYHDFSSFALTSVDILYHRLNYGQVGGGVDMTDEFGYNSSFTNLFTQSYPGPTGTNLHYTWSGYTGSGVTKLNINIAASGDALTNHTCSLGGSLVIESITIGGYDIPLPTTTPTYTPTNTPAPTGSPIPTSINAWMPTADRRPPCKGNFLINDDAQLIATNTPAVTRTAGGPLPQTPIPTRGITTPVHATWTPNPTMSLTPSPTPLAPTETPTGSPVPYIAIATNVWAPENCNPRARLSNKTPVLEFSGLTVDAYNCGTVFAENSIQLGGGTIPGTSIQLPELNIDNKAFVMCSRNLNVTLKLFGISFFQIYWNAVYLMGILWLIRQWQRTL